MFVAVRELLEEERRGGLDVDDGKRLFAGDGSQRDDEVCFCDHIRGSASNLSHFVYMSAG